MVLLSPLGFVSTAPAAVHAQDLRLEMADGTSLAATVWRPTGPTPRRGWPTVVALHGWRGNRGSVAYIARSIAPAGIQVLAYDDRGFGQSRGLSDLGGPTTVGDLRAIVGWLRGGKQIDVSPAVAPRAQVDQIGLYGRSAGAGQALAAVTGGLHVQALVVVNPWVDLQRALAPGGVPKSGFARGFLAGCHRNCAPAAQSAFEDLRGPKTAAAALPFLRARDFGPLLHRVRAPTMIVQGQADPLFPVDQGLALYRGLPAGVARYLYIGQLGHSSGPEPSRETAVLRSRIVGFLSAHLKPSAATGRRSNSTRLQGVELHAIAPFTPGTTRSSLPRATGGLRWRLGTGPAASIALATGGTASMSYPAPTGWIWGPPLVTLQIRARPGRLSLNTFSIQLWRSGSGQRRLLATGGVSLASPLDEHWRTVRVRLSFAADDPPRHSKLSLTLANGVSPTSVAYGSSLPASPPASAMELRLGGFSSVSLRVARGRAPTGRVLAGSSASSTEFGGDGLEPATR